MSLGNIDDFVWQIDQGILDSSPLELSTLEFAQLSLSILGVAMILFNIQSLLHGDRNAVRRPAYRIIAGALLLLAFIQFATGNVVDGVIDLVLGAWHYFMSCQGDSGGGNLFKLNSILPKWARN